MNETYRWIIQSCEDKLADAEKVIKKLMKDIEVREAAI